MATVRTSFRLGMTQRIVQADGYDEPRDALAQDWHQFIEKAFPHTPWLPIPNVGEKAVDLFSAFECNGLILTGGETPGTSPKRDLTEKFLLDYALKNKIPVLGVCRGMQFLLSELGQELLPCRQEDHVAKKHAIYWNENIESKLPESIRSMSMINSFHEFAVFDSEDLRRSVNVLATCPQDKVVEAIKHRTEKIYGIMWHPERETEPNASDIDLFRHVFEWIE